MSTVTASATRIIDAPCDKAWRAETDPQYFEQWFGAKPGSARTDPRSGGTWSAVVTPDGKEIELSGQYVEVIEHRRSPRWVSTTRTAGCTAAATRRWPSRPPGPTSRNT